MQFTDGAKAYGGGLAYGSGNSLFGSAEYVHTQFDDIDAGANGVSLQGGYSIAMNTSRTVQLCPLVGFAYQSGPNVDTGIGSISSSIRAFALGGSIGTTVPMSPTLDLVPFGGALYEMDHFSSSLSGVGSTSGDDNTTVIQVGAGFVFNKTFTVLPSVLLPTESGSKPTWSIAFAFNFGQPAK